MTGAEWAAIAAVLGPTLSGLFGNDQQERKSFADDPARPGNDPRNILSSNRNVLDSLFGTLRTRAENGVSLPSAYAQQPGAYTGGGMAMPIGLVASDPALSNPLMLSIPGISGVRVDPTPRDRTNPPRDPTAPPPDDGTGDGVPTIPPDVVDPGESGPYFRGSGASAATVSGPRRRVAPDGDYGQLVRATDLGGGEGGDELSRAMGSVQLLLEAFGGGRGATAQR